MGLAFISTILAARILGANDYGIYSWATSVAITLQTFAVLGFDRLGAREFGRGSVTGEHEKMAGVLFFGRRLIVAASVAIVGSVACLSVAAASGEQRTALWLALLGVPFIALTTFRQGVTQGLGRVVAGRIAEDIGRPIILSLLFVGAILVGRADDLGSTGALVLQMAAIVAAFLLGTAIVRAALPRQVVEARPGGTSQEWARQALPLGLESSGSMLLSQLGVILLGLLASPSDVAAYAIAVKVAAVVALPEYALNSALMPIFARLDAAGEIDRMSRAAAVGSAAVFCGGLLVALPFLLVPDTIVSVFGPVPGAAEVLIVLTLTWLMSALGGLNGTLLVMSGRSRSVVLGVGVALAVNVVLSVVLIPVGGALGAAWAWFVASSVWNAFLAVQVRLELGFWASAFSLLSSTTRGSH